MKYEEISAGPNWHLVLSPEATSAIPYKAEKYEDGRENYGYRQLRGGRHLIAFIPEVQKFPALGVVLEAINSPESPYLSSACDCGIFPQGEGEQRHFAAGGFAILVLRVAERNREYHEFLTLAQALGTFLEARGPHSYSLVVSPLKDFFGASGYWCLRTGFAGLASEEAMAWKLGAEAAEKLAAAIRHTYVLT